MTTAHVGEKRALVFPVMCDAHLKIEFDDTNTSTKKGNLWRHDKSFTVEAVITPYDVNGLGHRTTGQGRLDSTKTPPSPNLSLDDHADTTSSYQSVSYFGSGRNTHKMMLFHNQYFKFFLQNTTSSNFNQPAEYKLVCEISDSTDTSNVVEHSVSSNAVFGSVNSLEGYYDADGLYSGIVTNKKKITTSASGSQTISVSSGAANEINTGAEIFDSSGTLIGTVSSVSGDNITLAASPATTVTSTIYTSQKKEALYIEQLTKVSCTFDENTVTLMVNNQPVARAKVNIGTFGFHASDCLIGKDGSNTNTQFMGELFEICMHRGKRPSATINTLTPNVTETFFHYEFGD